MSDLISDPAPFVTFYSYRGGVGRSMAVLNVSALLAARGFRVLVIDFDLEAPGLSHLLVEAREKQSAKGRKRKRNVAPCAGVVELLADAKARGKTSDLFSGPYPKTARHYTFDYPIPPELHAHQDGRLIIMPAGQTNESYSARLNDLDLAGLYQQGLGRGLMSHFKNQIATSGLYDFVIVDSRTGHSDEAGICTRDLADHLMIVSGFNRQNIAGTASFLTNLRATIASEGVKPKDPTLILSPVPIGEEQLLAGREKEAKELFATAWGSPLPLDLFIPYHPRLALTEDAYVTTRTASYLRDSYQEIEVRLLMAIDHLPGPLLSKAKTAINNGNGRLALAILERYAKLQASSSQSPSFSQRFPFGWQRDFDLEDDDPLLDKVLALPESESILRIYLETKSSTSDLFQLGRKLHERDATQRDVFDRMILQKKRISPGSLGNYANFLTDIREDHDAAEALYKRALEADPKDVNTLGDCGQLLIGRGSLPAGISQLRESWRRMPKKSDGNTAEVAYSLWLASVMIGREEPAWERAYKHLIEKDFKRHHWNFDAMLSQAKIKLDLGTYRYAEALAEAFLDETKVALLNEFPRWRNLQPCGPDLITPNGEIIELLM